jgi:flagellar biosynthesis protein FlhB
MKCTKMFTASWPYFTDIPLIKQHMAFDLQLFADEKTEEATPKKKEDSRRKGQVAKSVEINSAFVILTAFLALKMVGPSIKDELSNYMQYVLSNLNMADLTQQSVMILFMQMGIVFLKTAMPAMVVILIISLAISFFQVGFVFSLEPLMPQLDRINPLSGFQRLFSKRALVELVKSIFKVLIVGYFIYRFMSNQAGHIPELLTTSLIGTMQIVASLILDLAFQIGAVILVLAIIDYFYQWWEHNESIKMSKHDIKEEFKQTEGNPQIKGKIKERQRAMAMRRMMQEVPQATAIVTNPTHFAVALKYKRTMDAPQVVAKGQDFLAERIKAVAKENGVAIVENKPLARALYDNVEVGDSVPPELYQAVAELLAYVYRLKKRLS